jgi:hypothetical protein
LEAGVDRKERALISGAAKADDEKLADVLKVDSHELLKDH